MHIFRGYRFRLSPVSEQEAQLHQYAGVTRLVYNLALEQRIKWGRGHRLNLFTQSREVTELRAQFDWIRAVPSCCPRQAIRDLDIAFARFFAKKSGLPTPRKKGVNDSFRFPGTDVSTKQINSKWSAVYIPKVGFVKYRDTRPMQGELRNVTVSHEADGWYVSFQCKAAFEAPAARPEVVGIDRGVATTLALSTGEMLSLPASLNKTEASKRKAQKIASRRKRGSKRRARAQRRVARLQAQQARIRRDFHHRAALNIARRFGVAVLEDLKTRQMTASPRGTVAEPGQGVRSKAGLNRSILNAGWNQFATILAYKMEERGGQVATIPARMTSQTCTACGVVDVASRKSQARFVCVSCGHTDHADTNAAINIKLRWSTPLLDVEGSGISRPTKRQPDEASKPLKIPA